MYRSYNTSLQKTKEGRYNLWLFHFLTLFQNLYWVLNDNVRMRQRRKFVGYQRASWNECLFLWYSDILQMQILLNHSSIDKYFRFLQSKKKFRHPKNFQLVIGQNTYNLLECLLRRNC